MNSVDYEAFLRYFLERFLPEQSKGIFPHTGHDMMLEDGWQAVADCFRTWLDEKGL